MFRVMKDIMVSIGKDFSFMGCSCSCKSYHSKHLFFSLMNFLKESMQKIYLLAMKKRN